MTRITKISNRYVDQPTDWGSCGVCGTTWEAAANGEPVSFCNRCEEGAL